MKMIFKIYWVASWMFFIGWCYHIVATIGWDVIMPMRLKLPLILSFFLPVLIWSIFGLYETFKRERNEKSN